MCVVKAARKKHPGYWVEGNVLGGQEEQRVH